MRIVEQQKTKHNYALSSSYAEKQRNWGVTVRVEAS